MAKFTDYLIIPDLSTPAMLPQTEVSLYCYDKLVYFDTTTHNLLLYLVIWIPNVNKCNSGLCVFVPKFANLLKYNSSIIIVCTGPVLLNDL